MGALCCWRHSPPLGPQRWADHWPGPVARANDHSAEAHPNAGLVLATKLGLTQRGRPPPALPVEAAPWRKSLAKRAPLQSNRQGAHARF